jgi:Flp pilus assembly protein TadG
MLRRTRREDGAAAVEFAIVLPLLLVFLALVAPLVQFGYEYMVLQRAASHGVRYASRADVNPRVVEGGPTRRPSVDEVAQFVSDSANGRVAANQVTVTPNPRLALPGELITVSVDYEVSYGPLAGVASAVKSTFFGGSAFPTSTPVTVSARGREE